MQSFAALFGFFAVGFLKIETGNTMLSVSYSVPSMMFNSGTHHAVLAIPGRGVHHEKAALDHWIREYLGRAA